ncbi:MAG: HAD family phosphatase [Sphingobacteriales bacterium]|nr:HAD family phosphatase [Sphingobacteriales bacterium]OJY92525.1 MAG: HAD family hydrolase [Sphingobacteriales bacterium 44-15]
MHFKDIKLIATDMDGTLLNAAKELPVNFLPVFGLLHAQGILFAAASGRQFYNIRNQFTTIQEEVIFIAENGSYVVYRDQELFVQAIDRETVGRLITIARGIPDAFIILCGKKQAYIENDTPEFVKNVNMYYDRWEKVDDLLQVHDDAFLKIAICDLAGSESNSFLYFKHLEKELEVKVSGSIWLDLSHKLANKGRAINVLQKHFGIDFNGTMVFGDYLNDLEMMKEGYFSYAMENAHPDVKAAARFITASNEENGVMQVLESLLAEKRVSNIPDN